MRRSFHRLLATLSLLALVSGCLPFHALTSLLPKRVGTDGTAHIAELLSYLGEGWPDSELSMWYGPVVHFLDLAHIRAAHDLPAAEHPLNDQERRKLLIALGTSSQALPLFPSHVDPLRADFASLWGWDITVVEAVLYMPDVALAVIIGPLDREEIGAHLAGRSESLGAEGGFDRYLVSAESLWVAVGDGALLLCQDPKEDITVLDMLLQAHSRGGAAQHPTIQALLKGNEGSLGGVLAPSSNPSVYVKSLATGSSAEMQTALKEMYGESPDVYFAWDMAAITFYREDDTFTIEARYHYPSADVALDDVATVRRALEETPLFRYRGKKLGEMMDVQSVKASGAIVYARAQTGSASLLGGMLSQRDAFGLFPLHERER